LQGKVASDFSRVNRIVHYHLYYRTTLVDLFRTGNVYQRYWYSQLWNL